VGGSEGLLEKGLEQVMKCGGIENTKQHNSLRKNRKKRRDSVFKPIGKEQIDTKKTNGKQVKKKANKGAHEIKKRGGKP